MQYRRRKDDLPRYSDSGVGISEIVLYVIMGALIALIFFIIYNAGR